jgi:hypothetical protein
VQDGFLYPFRVREDFVIPETQPAAAPQPFRAAFIGLVVGVLSVIGLDDEAMLDAGEIGDERANRGADGGTCIPGAAARAARPRGGARRRSSRGAGRAL